MRNVTQITKNVRMRDTPHLQRYQVTMTARGWSAKTIRERSIAIRRLGPEPETATEADVLAVLSAPALAPSTRATYHNHYRAWFGWLIETGHRADDPMQHLAKPRAKHRAILVPTVEQLEALLSSRIHTRTRWMITLAAYQGLRASEIARVHDADIDLASRSLRVLGKGQRVDYLPLSRQVADIAAATRDGDGGFWFASHADRRRPIHGNSVSRIIGDAMRRAGVPGTCHTLRHWHATQMRREGVDLRLIQDLMRHATLATTERYLHVDADERTAALDRLPDVTRRLRVVA